MCITCLAFSALSLFTPVTEVPQSVDIQLGTVREITFQADSLKVAHENQVAITRMINQLPDSPEMLILRAELQSLRVQLDVAKNDTEAEAIIYNGLQALSKRVMASSSAEKIIEVLRAMVVEEEDVLSTLPASLNRFQDKNYGLASLIGRSKSWGWLG